MQQLQGLFGLTGKVALVTGASSGLGTHAALALAKAGASVALLARRKDRLDIESQKLDAIGTKNITIAADATDREQIKAAYDQTEATMGPIDILVHGAGIAKLRRAEKHSREDWDSVMSINLTAGLDLAQEFATRYIEREATSGRIIFLSSVMGLVGNSVHRCVSYQAAKHGLNGLTKQLAIEWAKLGITVNSIAPSYFPTEMTIDPQTGKIPEEMLERIENFTPMGRAGNPEEIESAVVFLASPKSSYVTGSIIPVDGGWTAW
ncbi:MAG: SDR family oxidoreductase [Pseudomonadales bacterium]|nr:SDR family oxidoreductase [Pseudomonadales bacterium]|tara:strand:- start:385 stop:1176 length:792 start_codon:yes stop_codon:yes gene_type:complete